MKPKVGPTECLFTGMYEATLKRPRYFPVGKRMRSSSCVAGMRLIRCQKSFSEPGPETGAELIGIVFSDPSAKTKMFHRRFYSFIA